MLSGRSLPALVLALVVYLGLAGGAVRCRPIRHPEASSSISAPRQSLPTPIHDEATCAFCQAAIFPPCAPQPANVAVGEQAERRAERAAPDARVPRAAAGLRPSSRAPPILRFV